MHASVTFWEATAPVKLPFTSCLYKKFSKIKKKEWYFIIVKTSLTPIYSTQFYQYYNLRS
jgi:hypothetical protein